MTVLLVHCTCPDTGHAERIAHALVTEHLAACVSTLPGITSTFRWEDAVQSQSEVLLLIKTTRERYDAMAARLLDLHPYELPELIAVDVCAGHPAYLEWVAGQTFVS